MKQFLPTIPRTPNIYIVIAVTLLLSTYY